MQDADAMLNIHAGTRTRHEHTAVQVRLELAKTDLVWIDAGEMYSRTIGCRMLIPMSALCMRQVYLGRVFRPFAVDLRTCTYIHTGINIHIKLSSTLLTQLWTSCGQHEGHVM